MARTWGNVSCRIDEGRFVVTPSGRKYDDLLPKDMVVVDIRTGNYEGTVKPSAESKLHGAIYRKRGEAGSTERRNYCARRYIDCMKQGLQECRSEYQSAEDILRCDRLKIGACNSFWGGESDCVTRAKDGAPPAVPTRPGGNTQSPLSRTPSRIAPPPYEIAPPTR